VYDLASNGGATRPPQGSRPETAPQHVAAPGRAESRVQRTDRVYAELLQEVRIAQGGIQILFGSLLYVGVNPAFAGTSVAQRTVYCVSVMSAIGAAGTLVAPAALHRFLRGHRVKRELITAGHRHLMSGLAFLALALSSALMLILDMALGSVPAYVGGGSALAWFALVWVLGPLRARNRTCPAKGAPKSDRAPGRDRPGPLSHLRIDVAALRQNQSALRRRTVGTVLGGYLSYALLSCLAPSLTSIRVLGNITLGMTLGAAQIGIAIAVLALHARRTGRVIEPLAERIRIRLTAQRAAREEFPR